MRYSRAARPLLRVRVAIGQNVVNGARVRHGRAIAKRYSIRTISQNDAATPVMLSPAISPAAAVIANRSVMLGQRQPTS